ncbi:hypothetical protein C7447_10216 [Tenacibaculum adriaticum]|uniref:Uncharacterized protein n=1 Tax=Tenacibaculum adriaticum TaxID=413713 RepID=A0A5S5DS41_9FLAO|nr:hypothetical protein [Tenacibaculum adriaticum]TYP98701.1 hypothetical protein C7447_10216 [Tenacibaculum adriaticum]
MEIKNFNQRNYNLNLTVPDSSNFRGRIEEGNHDFSYGNVNRGSLLAHGLLFSPSIKLVKYTEVSNKFYLVITFTSFNGVKVDSLQGVILNGSFHFLLYLNYSDIDYSTYCVTEVIFDTENVEKFHLFLTNVVKCYYAVHIENPLSKEGFKQRDTSLVSKSNGTGGSTDPIDDFPK